MSHAVKRFLRGLAVGLIALWLPVVLLAGGLRLLMSNLYLQAVYQQPSFPADPYGFSLADRLTYAPYALRYLSQEQPLAQLAEVVGPSGGPLFNARELKHMDDVQAVTAFIFRLGLAGAAILLALTAILWRAGSSGRLWRAGLRNGSLLILAGLAALLLYIVLDWDHFFDSFHDLFFAAGSWRFASDDALIRLFPIRFWQDSAIVLGVFLALAAVAILLGLWRTNRRTKKN
jgi:integral membrane protein (TIGR01906 family)